MGWPKKPIFPIFPEPIFERWVAEPRLNHRKSTWWIQKTIFKKIYQINFLGLTILIALCSSNLLALFHGQVFFYFYVFLIIFKDRLARDRLRASDLYDFEFIDMILEVIRSTRRSQKIQKICNEFLESKSITHFAALHWRYDVKDWLNLNTKNQQRTDTVGKIKSIRADPTEFSQKVIAEMKKIEATTILLFRKGINFWIDAGNTSKNYKNL